MGPRWAYRRGQEDYRMTIYFDDEEAFYNGVAACVQRGLTFKADATKLRIELTGGF